MPVPKRRLSRRRRNQRRSHDALKPIQTITCSHCGEAALPHRVCPACGHYRGREVVPIQEI